jgi:hypothetical protein
MILMKTPNPIPNTRRFLNIALAALFLAGLNLRGDQPAANDADQQTSNKAKRAVVAAEDRAKCEENLLKVSAAIEAYRKAHQELPSWLSDLVPDYLADTNGVICPVSTRTGKKEGGMNDPKIRNAYHYEFNPSRIDVAVQSFWGETIITMREWKQQQEKIVGAQIPVVRCFMHGAESLDLTLEGKVRADPLIWEQQFTNDKVKLKDLAPYPVTKPGPAHER